MSKDIIWECECGNIEYGEFAPQECDKCFKIGSFAQLPEELLDERSKESLGDDTDKLLISKLKFSKKSRSTKFKIKRKGK